MRIILFASLLFAAAQAEDKVLYDKDMGPETQICDPMPVRVKPDYSERDQNFDELPPEADWPSRHDDPYPAELELEVEAHTSPNL